MSKLRGSLFWKALPREINGPHHMTLSLSPMGLSLPDASSAVLATKTQTPRAAAPLSTWVARWPGLTEPSPLVQRGAPHREDEDHHPEGARAQVSGPGFPVGAGSGEPVAWPEPQRAPPSESFHDTCRAIFKNSELLCSRF